MGAIVAIKSNEGETLRVGLREAISAASASRALLAECRQQMARVEELIVENRIAAEEAGRTVLKAQEQDALVLAETGSMPAAPATRVAREREQEARDALQVARSAMARLRQDVHDLEQRDYLVEHRVDAALGAALRPIAEPMLERVNQLQGQLARLQVGLSEIGRSADPELSRKIESTFTPGATADAAREAATAGLAERWQAALSAMRAGDLDIELPS
jgi:hypothetical protein